MRGTIIEIVSGIGLLIAIFLFLSNADSTVNVIKQLGTSSTSMIRVLQGRG